MSADRRRADALEVSFHAGVKFRERSTRSEGDQPGTLETHEHRSGAIKAAWERSVHVADRLERYHGDEFRFDPATCLLLVRTDGTVATCMGAKLARESAREAIQAAGYDPATGERLDAQSRPTSAENHPRQTADDSLEFLP